MARLSLPCGAGNGVPLRGYGDDGAAWQVGQAPPFLPDVRNEGEGAVEDAGGAARIPPSRPPVGGPGRSAGRRRRRERRPLGQPRCSW